MCDNNMQDVSFEGNVVAGAPAGDQTVAVARVAPRPTVYSIPPINVWQWPGGPTTMTEPELGSEEFFSSDVARVNAAMRAAQQVRARLARMHVHVYSAASGAAPGTSGRTPRGAATNPHTLRHTSLHPAAHCCSSAWG